MILVPLLLLAGCGFITQADQDAWMDPDGDGVLRGVDCDDEDDRIGAAGIWYEDRDGDGYGGPGPKPACEPEQGLVATGDDCDDEDPEIHPGADEICDGLDNDCDDQVDVGASDATTWYLDADGDGAGDPEAPTTACEAPAEHVSGSDDCDDTRAEVNPLATEVCVDGLDNDCDGGIDGCVVGLETSTSLYLGEAEGDYAGYGLAGVGDVDLDGQADFAVSAIHDDAGGTDAGKVYLVSRPVAGEQDLGGIRLQLTGAEAGGYAGVAMAGLDGEAVLVSAPEATGESGTVQAGRVYLVDTPVSSLSLSSATATFAGAARLDWLGTSLIDAGDVDGDGTHDWAASAIGQDAAAAEAGAVYLVDGTGRGDARIDDVGLVLLGAGSGDKAGYELASGDLDGDGSSDLVIGAPYADEGFDNAGAVYVFLGPLALTGAEVLGMADADAWITGEAEDAWLGGALAVVPDFGASGETLLAAGSVGVAEEAGALYLLPLSGMGAGTPADEAATLRIPGDGAGDWFGGSVAPIGDVDGDGFTDLAAGAALDDSAGHDAGKVWLLAGGRAHVDLSSASLSLEGTGTNDGAGWPVAGPGDVTGDGLPDLLIGAWAHDTTVVDAGAAYLISGI